MGFSGYVGYSFMSKDEEFALCEDCGENTQLWVEGTMGIAGKMYLCSECLDKRASRFNEAQRIESILNHDRRGISGYSGVSGYDLGEGITGYTGITG